MALNEILNTKIHLRTKSSLKTMKDCPLKCVFLTLTALHFFIKYEETPDINYARKMFKSKLPNKSLKS